VKTPTVSLFFLHTLLWLLPALFVWYQMSAALAQPVGWVAAEAMQLLFPWANGGYQMNGSAIDLLTNLQVPDPAGYVAGRIAMASPEADYRLFGFGLPMLLALLLAAKPKHLARKIGLGVLVLVPIQVLGIMFAWLKAIAIDLNAELVMQTSFTFFDRNAIALGYQLSTLILPTLAPIVIWLVLDRETFMRIWGACTVRRPSVD
jgi:hypothetical protein